MRGKPEDLVEILGSSIAKVTYDESRKRTSEHKNKICGKGLVEIRELSSSMVNIGL